MQRQSGFTLVEIMIAVVIIGILTAVALPSYSSYVMRARLAEAQAALAEARANADRALMAPDFSRRRADRRGARGGPACRA